MQKTAALGEGSVFKTLMKLAIPAVLAQIVNLLYNIIDRMYVGRIPEVGTQALAGLGVCFPILIIVSAFGILFGMGGAPLAAIRFGENDEKGAERIMNNAFAMILLCAVVLTVTLTVFPRPILRLFGIPDDAMEYGASYLAIYATGTVFVLISVGMNSFITTQGFSKTSMCTILIGAALNIALDPLFIFVFKMGVSGAALATVISQAASAVWVVLFLCGKRTQMRLRPSLFRPRAAVLLPMLALGLSPFIMQVTDSAAQIVFNVQLNRLTGGSSDYIAAMSVLLSAMQLVGLPLAGLGAGAQPLVSYNYGAGKFTRVKQTVKYLLMLSAIFTVSAWLLCLLCPQVFAWLFKASAAVTDIVRHALPIFMAGTVLFVFQWSLQNTFVALGQAKVSMCLAVLRKLVLLIPLTFLLPLGLGVDGVFWAESIGDIIAALTTLTVFSLSFPKILRRRGRELAAAAQQPESNLPA